MLLTNAAGSACNSNEVPDAEAAPSRGAARRSAKQNDATENEASSAARQPANWQRSPSGEQRAAAILVHRERERKI